MANLNCFAFFGDDEHPFRDGVSNALQGRVGQLFELLWDLSLGALTNLILLHQNTQRLEDEMAQLEELRDDLRSQVNVEAAQPRTEIMYQVRGWLDRVEKLRSQVTKFQAALERQSMFITGFCLGYSAVDSLRRARELAGQGRNFSKVTGPAPPGTDTLSREKNELRVMRNDLVRRVEAMEAADPQVRRTHLVESWVEGVDTLLLSCASLEASAAAEVTEMLGKVRDFKLQGKDLEGRDLLSRLPPFVVEEVPSIPDSFIVGGEETLARIRSHLRDQTVGIIGIYGMGGVGKTTLLRKINNELLQTDSKDLFDIVAWAAVSKDMNILAVQRELGARIGLQLQKGGEEGAAASSRLADDQAKLLFRVLSRKRFLIFLDDVWKCLDLDKIGIPHPRDRENCKLAFTTRSVEVCNDMDADSIVQVEPLNEDQSWELFCRKVGSRGEALNDPSIRPLAKEVVRRCGGLPLALTTVGRAMAGKVNCEEWDHAIQALDESATELRGMESVLSNLKFSYDRLEDDKLRACLLYCVLFPEDAEIPREDLVEYWVGEGLLDDDGNDHDFNRARRRGHYIISRLQDACLLEPAEGRDFFAPYGPLSQEKAVRMHDLIRDMALWLTSGQFIDSNTFIVMAGGYVNQVPRLARWEDARRISLVENRMEVLSVTAPNCPYLSTLLLSSSWLGESAMGGFFGFMPLLRILNLSHTNIEEVPVEIGSLLQLRYLNLSHTIIKSLPQDLGNLSRLRLLVLLYTTQLRGVPQEAIMRMTNLQVLDMHGSYYHWDGDTEDRGHVREDGVEDQRSHQLGVRDLENLCWLRDLRIALRWGRNSVSRLASSDVVLRSTIYLTLPLSEDFEKAIPGLLQLRQLCLSQNDDDRPGRLWLGPGQLPALQLLVLYSIKHSLINVQAVPNRHLPLQSLRFLTIVACDTIEDLTWAGQLPCLQVLTVKECKSPRTLLKDGEEVGRDQRNPQDYDMASFSRLRSMTLNGLVNLSSISWRLLLLPSLEELWVLRCPKLKRLPLGTNSTPKMRRISGEQYWWDGLDWDDIHEDGSSSIRSYFLSYFEPLVIDDKDEQGEGTTYEQGPLTSDEEDEEWEDTTDDYCISPTSDEFEEGEYIAHDAMHLTDL